MGTRSAPTTEMYTRCPVPACDAVKIAAATTTDPQLPGGPITDGSSLFCGPDQLRDTPPASATTWFFADSVHPSTGGHRAISEGVLADLRSFGHRSRELQMGYGYDDFMGKPVVAIINTWSDINPCHTHFKQRVFNRAFDDPFKLALMLKDIGIALQLMRRRSAAA